jgi:hypothetical protein
MAAWTDDDALFAELREWLIGQGFVVLSDQYSPDSFGNQVVTLARPIGVRLARDRGQWSVYLCGPDGDWRPLHEWVAELTGERARDFSAAADATHLRTLLSEIEQKFGHPDRGHLA